MEPEIASSGVGHKKSASAYHCPDRQMGNREEAAPQPPQALLFATSLRRSSDFTFDPEGQGAKARQILDRKGTPLLFPRAFALIP